MSKLFVVLPCYNESENVREVINQWLNFYDHDHLSVDYELEVVIIDDGSTDETVSIVEQEMKLDPRVSLVKHVKNKGLGGAIRTGLMYSLKHGHIKDRICIMDSDNTHKVQFVKAMFSEAQDTNADCIIASRFQKGAEIHGVSLVRQLLSIFARGYYSVSLRVPQVRDYTCGYRLYTYASIDRLYQYYGEHMISENGFTCMVELLTKLHRTGTKFGEIPFSLRYDHKGGASKIEGFSKYD